MENYIVLQRYYTLNYVFDFIFYFLIFDIYKHLSRLMVDMVKKGRVGLF